MLLHCGALLQILNIHLPRDTDYRPPTLLDCFCQQPLSIDTLHLPRPPAALLPPQVLYHLLRAAERGRREINRRYEPSCCKATAAIISLTERDITLREQGGVQDLQEIT
ncbi:unnamed protein product [Pleuronectes platessa]|uniref:Uncharacterized protein n=1 Tax=Pleuronectes platessa TaxID=8262 RepID=A0A9N7Z362_PLEPL|nr:unnamed protein product [Pleuronectes platessa]